MLKKSVWVLADEGGWDAFVSEVRKRSAPTEPRFKSEDATSRLTQWLLHRVPSEAPEI